MLGVKGDRRNLKLIYFIEEQCIPYGKPDRHRQQ